MAEWIESRVRNILGSKLLKTHWGVRLRKASECRRFTDKDKNDAACWPTCACGKMHARKPYHEGDNPQEPVDRELQRLGTIFYECVRDGLHHTDQTRREKAIVQAAETMVAIEKQGSLVGSA